MTEEKKQDAAEPIEDAALPIEPWHVMPREQYERLTGAAKSQ